MPLYLPYFACMACCSRQSAAANSAALNSCRYGSSCMMCCSVRSARAFCRSDFSPSCSSLAAAYTWCSICLMVSSSGSVLGRASPYKQATIVNTDLITYPFCPHVIGQVCSMALRASAGCQLLRQRDSNLGDKVGRYTPALRPTLGGLTVARYGLGTG